jgi:hypothetical protein
MPIITKGGFWAFSSEFSITLLTSGLLWLYSNDAYHKSLNEIDAKMGCPARKTKGDILDL